MFVKRFVVGRGNKQRDKGYGNDKLANRIGKMCKGQKKITD
jgi:hypothetical protein